MALNDTIGTDVSAISAPNADELGMIAREVTLQTLDVFLPYSESSTGRLFYSKDKFEGSIDAWNGRYFIYSPSKQHIDWIKYQQNPAKELQRNNAKLVGITQSTRIPESGTPRLDSWVYFWDDEVNSLADSGKLGISTDFNVQIDGENMVGYPMPNYILVFPIDVVNDQNDIGARVLNSSIDNKLEDKMDDEMKGAFSRLEGVITGLISVIKGSNVQNSAPEENFTSVQAAEIHPSVPVEYLNQIEQMKAENEQASAKLAELQTQYDALKADAATREEADKQAESARLESIWQTTIMPKLPAALLVDEAKAAEIKKLAIESPLEFMQQYGDSINKTDNVANTAVKGQTVQNTADDESKPIVIGSYNARKGGFE